MSFTNAHVGDLAAALVDDQLDQDTRDQVLLHLGRCPGCRSDVQEQRQLKARLHALSTPGLPSGLIARLGALSLPELPEEPPELALLSVDGLPSRRPSLLRNPQRGRRLLVGAASLLLVGAGTAVAAGGDGQSPLPASPASTFSTSFTTPIGSSRNDSGGSSMPLTDPAFRTMLASFSH
jgi:anti-sigma factor RsiW